MSDEPQFERPRVGQLLYHLRQRARLSQAELSYLTANPELNDRGVNETTIGDIENGNVARPQTATLERLALALSRRVTWLSPQDIRDLLVEAKEHRPVEYRVAPELVEINDRLQTYPHRTRRALLAFLVAAYDNLEALLARVIPPAPPEA